MHVGHGECEPAGERFHVEERICVVLVDECGGRVEVGRVVAAHLGVRVVGAGYGSRRNQVENVPEEREADRGGASCHW